MEGLIALGKNAENVDLESIVGDLGELGGLDMGNIGDLSNLENLGDLGNLGEPTLLEVGTMEMSNEQCDEFQRQFEASMQVYTGHMTDEMCQYMPPESLDMIQVKISNRANYELQGT